MPDELSAELTSAEKAAESMGIGPVEVFGLIQLAMKVWELIKPIWESLKPLIPSGPKAFDVATLTKWAEKAVAVLQLLSPAIQSFVAAVVAAWPQILALFAPGSTGSAMLAAE